VLFEAEVGMREKGAPSREGYEVVREEEERDASSEEEREVA
jgi:hypothetical protein